MSYIISYVGAGGKTSSIYQDAAAFVNEGKKVMITTTTHMYVPCLLYTSDAADD